MKLHTGLENGDSEANLKAKGYSTADERRILDALGRCLLKELPNPDRVGCPGSDVLKRIASHKMPLSEADKWLDHLTSGSPCYSDLLKLQTEVGVLESCFSLSRLY